MPHALMSNAEVVAVDIHTAALQNLLQKAVAREKNDVICSFVVDAEFEAEIENFARIEEASDQGRSLIFAAIETAFRTVFQELLVRSVSTSMPMLIAGQSTTTVTEPAFNHIWHLLDIASVLSDNGMMGSAGRDTAAHGHRIL